MLDKRFKQDPATSTVTFAKTFGWAAQVLGIQTPELYVRNDVPGAIVAVPAMPPASVAGQTVLTGFKPQELTFICGKHLAHYRGEHYIRTLFPTVRRAHDHALRRRDDRARRTRRCRRTWRSRSARRRRSWRSTCSRSSSRACAWSSRSFIDEGAKANIKRWNQAVELTACRAGLVVSGDLEIAKKIIGAEPQLPGDLTPRGEDEGAPALQRERAVLGHPQGARHRGRGLTAPLREAGLSNRQVRLAVQSSEFVRRSLARDVEREAGADDECQ